MTNLDVSRIPKCDVRTPEGMGAWFAEMEAAGLLFHPDDAPADVVALETGERVFTEAECRQLEVIIAELFEHHPDRIHEAALAASGFETELEA